MFKPNGNSSHFIYIYILLSNSALAFLKTTASLDNFSPVHSRGTKMFSGLLDKLYFKVTKTKGETKKDNNRYCNIAFQRLRI